ncbi:MAG: hypothetical protein J5I59_11530 [Saprospiraceae bacterium]|nr:hypothetical protein [Saprospiraceae bacterium]
MHDIEPYYSWRDYYISSEDKNSPFFDREPSEFYFTNKIYNHYIHPQWDDFGSSTMYLKILFADYDEGYIIIELIGEWNDALHNDIMELKRTIIDHFIALNITKFIIIGEHVLNFHSSDDCYYEEWYDDLKEEAGWVVMLGLADHVIEEMDQIRLFQYILYGNHWNELNWRALTPLYLCRIVDKMIENPKLIGKASHIIKNIR